MAEEAATTPPEEAPDPLIGVVLGGRYRIEKQLGEGGMGTVYIGMHEGIGKKVAIKCLNPEMASNKAVVERFKREARAATAAGNEHIIDVTDMGELPDGAPYIVMELLKGRELAELLDAVGPLPTGRAVKIMLEVCDALSAAHDKGIVHRDLKPENIFLVAKKRNPDFVKVLDFGIARFNEPATIGGGRNLTATGMTIGTPHYMSPEQAQGLPNLDYRTDLYALGVILYEMLAGERPFNAETFPLLIVAIVTTDAPTIRLKRPDIPEGLAVAISKCLAKEADHRWESVDDFAAAIEPYSSITDAPDVRGGSMRPTGRPKSRERPKEGGASTRVGVKTPSPAEKRAAPTVDGPGQEAHRRVPAAPTPMPKLGAPTPGEHAAATPPRGEATALEQRVSKPRWPYAALALGAAIAVAGGVAVATSSPSEPETPETPENPETPETPEAIATMEPTMEPTMEATTVQQASEVQLRVVVAPADAKIFLDDVEFPSPLQARRPRSLTPVQLRIEHEGYVTLEELLVLDEDKELIRTLERGRSSRGMRANMTTTTAMTETTTVAPPVMMEATPMMDGFRDDF